MNIERLHRILLDLQEELDNINQANLIQQVEIHLQNQVSQPNQPSHQTNLVKSLENLYQALSKSKYNKYSPSWKQVIDEIAVDDLFGIKLKSKIKNILSANAITPAKALADIKEINNDFKQFKSAITNTLSGFEELGIEEEILEPGQCELGYTIPREFIDNKLSSFKDEIKELTFILNHISEAVEGEKQEFKIKTISSSDFLLYVIIGLQVADVLSKATERILNHYKQILEIKVLRNQLSEKGVPAAKTKSVDSYANGMMESEIKKIAKEVLDEHYKSDNGRKNELENGVVFALNKLANRIDNGFNVEIRVEPLPKPKKDEEVTEEKQAEIDLVTSIQESSEKIEFIETDGESILKLPENSGNEK
ncbi:hypothetical protein ATE84_0884 [Aquimarina sp. MAR_2010_214]|uniref:hypothetical protein n=1 Tax=Aquimarina sp. MAR_2010_214 TaxID=1250026 RepID=UPI000C706235|nr:hypothetical protein [Aquimarina sp. MAR_2010_214]PKV48869.1 hypothetical protein ATE84_0884 [Aquimarina sp. MAR_2010_214]